MGVIVVGADELSARLGAEQSQHIFESCGAILIAPPVVFGNLENEGITRSNVALLPGLAATLARGLHPEIHADTF